MANTPIRPFHRPKARRSAARFCAVSTQTRPSSSREVHGEHSIPALPRFHPPVQANQAESGAVDRVLTVPESPSLYYYDGLSHGKDHKKLAKRVPIPEGSTLSITMMGLLMEKTMEILTRVPILESPTLCYSDSVGQ